MSEIRIEGYTTSSVAGVNVGHLYLIYTNDIGQEFTIRGGPSPGTHPLLGDLTVEIGAAFTSFNPDWRPNTAQALADRGSTVLDLGGREAAEVWASMLQRAAQIESAGVRYGGNTQNSNTTIASILDSVGIDINSYLPPANGVDAWWGIDDIPSLGTMPAITDLAPHAASEYFDAVSNALNEAIEDFFDGLGIPADENGWMAGVPFDAEHTPAAYNALLASLGLMVAQIDQYIEDNEGELSAQELQELQDTREDLKDLSDNATLALIDPLVIDLDGDGIETISAQLSDANFDLLQSEGFIVDHGWVSPDDALLAVDDNGNGLIDDISELFGDASTSGFSELAAYDSNGDGQISAQDDNFTDLLVWQDVNGDGISQQNEVATLADHGINSISLGAEAANTVDNGNVITASSEIIFNDGRTTEIADVNFRSDFDTMRTNGETDLFDYSDLPEDDALYSFEDGVDQIILSGSGFDELELQQTTTGTIVTNEDGVDLFLAGISQSDLSADDFMFV